MSSRKTLVVLNAVLSAVLASPAQAQDFTSKNHPVLEAKTDAFGVDMASGTFITISPLTLKAPGAGHLAFRTAFNGRKQTFNLNINLDDHTYTPSYGNPAERHLRIHLGGTDKLFICHGVGACTPTIENDGSTLTRETTDRFVYRDNDGAVYTFFDQLIQTLPDPCNDEFSTCNAAGYFSDAAVSTIEYPNGEKLTFSPDLVGQTIDGTCYASDTITSNLGYSLSISTPAACNYTPTPSAPGTNWMYYKYSGIGQRRITLFSGSTMLGSLHTTLNWPAPYNNATLIQQDDLGRSYQINLHSDLATMCPNVLDSTQLNPTVVISPGGVRTDIAYHNLYVPPPGVPLGYLAIPVRTVTRGGQTWTYDLRLGGKTVTTPLGITESVSTALYTDTYFYGNITSPFPCPSPGTLGARIVQTRNGLDQQKSYTYDGRFVTDVTFPEGNGIGYGYDTRHNLTSVTNKAKPGSGQADLVSYRASYDSTCLNMKTCNQPNWTRDALNNQTDYAYDETHGGVRRVTLPADQNGLHLRTYYTYSPFDTGNGIIHRQTRSESCGLDAGQLTLPACPAASTTAVTVTSYGSSSTAPYTYSSFLPHQVTNSDGAGTLSATTTYGYDRAGRVVSVNGPRTDLDDTTYATYDIAGRTVFEIGADPDGSGPLPRVAVRHGYDDDDRERLVEVGACAAVVFENGIPSGCSSFNVGEFTRHTYENGRLVKTEKGTP
jgi:hypothetical protein